MQEVMQILHAQAFSQKVLDRSTLDTYVDVEAGRYFLNVIFGGEK